MAKMAGPGKELVIGLTGSFGSGCSTLAEALAANHGFSRFSLSVPVRESWKKRNPGAKKPAPRAELQDIGNELRSKDGESLAKATVDAIAASDGPVDKVVVDSIKNEAEVMYLREYFPYFFLIAVQANQDERWSRIRPQYDELGFSYSDFERDDIRDQVEDLGYGQQVQQCVDDADIVINNNIFRQSQLSAVKALGGAIGPYLGLLTQTDLRAPSRDEIMMSMAYSQAKASMCLKRHVGAVIAESRGNVVAAGFNENPDSMQPCYLEFGYCHKDATMIGELESLKGTMCPKCGFKSGHQQAALSMPQVCSQLPCSVLSGSWNALVHRVACRRACADKLRESGSDRSYAILHHIPVLKLCSRDSAPRRQPRGLRRALPR